jgi:hypothetical protein
MILDLAEVRRIAEEVARAEDPALEVIAAMASRGGSAYIELTLRIQRDGDEPSRVVVGADRSRGEAPLRRAIAREFRRASRSFRLRRSSLILSVRGDAVT